MHARRRTQERTKSRYSTCRLQRGQQCQDSCAKESCRHATDGELKETKRSSGPMQAEAQRGLVAMGSPVAVEDLVVEVQRVVNTISAEALDQQIKTAQDSRDKAEELMKMLETEKQRSAEIAKGKKRAAEVAVERGGKSGKPSRKGKHLLAQNHCAIGWQ